MGYKDLIKGWVENFIVVELKESLRIIWDIDLLWGEVPQDYNSLG